MFGKRDNTMVFLQISSQNIHISSCIVWEEICVLYASLFKPSHTCRKPMVISRLPNLWKIIC